MIFDAIKTSYTSYTRFVKTSVLNEIIQDAQIMNPTPHFKGGRLKIYYGNQVSIMPPTFVLFVNDTNSAHFSYMRYIENRIRDTYEFEGTPIKLILRERK